MNSSSRSDQKKHHLRTRFKETVRAEILAAAEGVFAEQGLEAARIADVAARCGVAVGTIYNHFHDRKALLDELLSMRRLELSRRLDQPLAGRTFAEQLQEWVETVFTHFREHRGFFEIIARSAPAPRSAVSSMRRSATALVGRGVQDGQIDASSDADFAADVLVAVVRASLAREFGGGRPVSSETVVRLFLRGAGAER